MGATLGTTTPPARPNAPPSFSLSLCSFLSPLLPAWDPSLAFVMGGALCVTLPTFQLLMRSHAAPLCTLDLSLPTLKHIDAPLLVGSALFGAG